MSTPPFFSIIIPVHNARDTLPACLAAIRASYFTHYELLVVDDGSSDGSLSLAQAAGATLLTTQQPGQAGPAGPAAARNLAAGVARGRYLFFTDADCRLHPNTLAHAAAILQANPHLDALIGSYDDAPAGANFISQYKNLFHHYIHHTSRPTAATFWTGCGAIRRDRFLALGGFDSARYPRPSIEDIELGYRLTAQGGHIRLDPTIQVQHLKRWTLATLLRSDILDRALPWSVLLRQHGRTPADLNVRPRHRLSAVLLWLALGSATSQRLRRLTTPLLLTLALLNLDLYRFFWRKRGLWFALRAVPLHWLYYAYSSLAFAWSTGRVLLPHRSPT